MIVGVWVLVGETNGEGVVGSCTGVWGNWGIAGVAGVVVGVPEKKNIKKCNYQKWFYEMLVIVESWLNFSIFVSE